MPLLQLPPETLKFIFDYVGPAFFHEDVGRLTVCKQWFYFALPTCFKHITLSQQKLRAFAVSRVIERPSFLRHSLETLDLKLRGFQPCTSTPNPQECAQWSNSLEATAPNEAPENNSVKSSIVEDLKQLAIVAQGSHSLRTLRIHAWRYPCAEPLQNLENSLLLPAIQAFLPIQNLRVLVLDIPGGGWKGKKSTGCHICPAISAILTTLKTLHLRMGTICPDVLKTRDPNRNLQLSEVVINMSLTTDLPEITSAAHSKRCGSSGGGLLQLKADIQERAEALMTQMASPKRIRILTHTLPQFETQSLDVLTGKTMVLEEGMAWDEDGKTVEENSEPESELLDDSAFEDE